MRKVNFCPVCGGEEFSFREILWPELISDWQLSPLEVDYINRQQGLVCAGCSNNLRSMALANAILSAYSFCGTLVQFVESELGKTLKVLEINEAGALTSVLNRLPHHQFVGYPNQDMTNLSFEPAVFDLVLHSDTLEHVPDPIAGLSECHRVLVKTGRCIFTVPIVVGRLTRSRAGLKSSYHGTSAQRDKDFTVYTEFGADAWRFVIEAGFTSVRMHSFEYPAALAIEAIIGNGR